MQAQTVPRLEAGANRIKGRGRDPPPLAPGCPKEDAHARAGWFRQVVLWQQRRRARKRKASSHPLECGKPVKFAALNVQGFAETLKLKSALQLMQEHDLGVLILSETKSHSYYSYNSEGHLVVLSGNYKDKHAGVGAIVAPWLRPHLVDTLQINPRIIQLSFKKKGGNFHILGVYAPHSGHDFEEVREPFWEQLENCIDNIPQPEPVYVTGDFNVRFQAKHKRDEGVSGPFVYGKGAQYIDRTANSNRTICIKTMSRCNMVEAVSYKSPNMMHHITYRDKAAPPTDWSQFVLDPLITQQVYAKLGEKFSNPAEVSAAISTDVPLPIHSDHTARVHYFTDASGTRGKCSSRAPAGWRFTYKVGDAWMDASGPVVTDPTIRFLRGLS